MSTPNETELGRYIPQASFLDRLADKLELATNARTVFGEPIERDGATVIPVAKAKFGMGGGSGRRDASEEDPVPRAETAGGGGTKVTPIGLHRACPGEDVVSADPRPGLCPVARGFGGLFGLSTLRAIGQMRGARGGLPIVMRRLRLRRLRRLFR